MNSFGLISETYSGNYFFDKQVIWVFMSLIVFFALSFVNFRFLKRTDVLVALFLIFTGVLSALFMFGSVVKGAQSWFSFGVFSLQPSDPTKLVVILILAKYFSRRHVEIAHIRHILVSGFYALVPFLLVFLQPDFGSAVIIFFIWLGMAMVSGISKRHLLMLLVTVITVLLALWSFGFTDNQKTRITSFLNPLTDIQGAGYNAFQSTVAVGSGQMFGSGVGYGTQSRLEFLPEFETDFIFAAFAEEWGFVGVALLFFLFGVIIWRILYHSVHGASNFESYFGIGLAILFMSHIVIHIGMNIGILPVTGLPLPFLSYGGSHLLTEFIGLGILMGMSRYEKITHRENTQNEFLGM